MPEWWSWGSFGIGLAVGLCGFVVIWWHIDDDHH